VYGLSSTEDGVIRYIGQTTKSSLKKRLFEHLAAAKRESDSSRCYRWIRKVLRQGHRIEINLLEDDCPWGTAEQRWIAQYRREHPGVLTNISEGGDGFTGKRTEEDRARRRHPKTEAHRAAIRAAMQRPKSAEERANRSRAQTGNAKSRGAANRHAVLSENDVRAIKRRLAEGGGVSAIAREYGLQKAAVSKIKTGRNWRHVAISDPV
jgi:hypothetical protein